MPHCAGLDVTAGLIAATTIGVIIGLVAAALMQAPPICDQARQVVRKWTPKRWRR